VAEFFGVEPKVSFLSMQFFPFMMLLLRLAVTNKREQRRQIRLPVAYFPMGPEPESEMVQQSPFLEKINFEVVTITTKACTFSP
jgi:hypothetical protein